MSYNLANHTNSLNPEEIPGCFLGDEIDALSRNKFAFPQLWFDPATDFCCPDVSAGCPPNDKRNRQAQLTPMDLVWCYTESGSDYGSSIRNLNDSPNRKISLNTPATGFDASTMWQSRPVNEAGWVSIEVTFPLAVTLDKVRVYSQHSGQYHRAEMIQVGYEAAPGDFKFLTRVTASTADVDVLFPKTTSTKWNVAFNNKSSGYVVIRGLRFFNGKNELYPPCGPSARTDWGEEYGSRVSNIVEIQRTIRSSSQAVGFDSNTMWHSGKVNEGGWVSVDVAFLEPVSLDRLLVYSEHSGVCHRAEMIQVGYESQPGKFVFLKRVTCSTTDTSLSFKRTTARCWNFAFHGTASGYVVIRGLRFFNGDQELFPPAVVPSDLSFAFK